MISQVAAYSRIHWISNSRICCFTAILCFCLKTLNRGVILRQWVASSMLSFLCNTCRVATLVEWESTWKQEILFGKFDTDYVRDRRFSAAQWKAARAIYPINLSAKILIEFLFSRLSNYSEILWNFFQNIPIETSVCNLTSDNVIMKISWVLINLPTHWKL